MDFGLVTVAPAALVPAALATIDSARQAGFRGRVDAFVIDPRGAHDLVTGGDWSDGSSVLPDPLLAHRIAPVDLAGMCAAAVPAAVLEALRHVPVVAYVSPTVHVLGALDDLAALASDRLALIERPRCGAPHDGRHPDEADLARARRFSASVFGAAATGATALEWWRDTAWAALVAGHAVDSEALLDRLAHRFGAAAPPHPARFADWFSFGVEQLHDDGRSLRVHGQPLITVDLAGHDSRHPHRLDDRQPTPHRVTLAELPSLAAALASRPPMPEPEVPLLPGGLEFDRIMRAAYASALRASVDAGARPPPNPYDDPATFVEWLHEAHFPTTERVSRYLREVYLSRPDLSRAFPEVPGRDTARFYEWAHEHGRAEIPIPDPFLPPRTVPARASASVRPLSTAVNLVGFLDASLGIGDVARRLGRALDAAGVAHADVSLPLRAGGPSAAFDQPAAPYETSIVCVNPDSLASVADHTGESFFRDRYTIGLWFWETAELAPAMAWAFDLVDEVWAASEFVAAALRARAPARVPVHLVKLPLLAPIVDQAFDLTELDLAAGRPTFVTSWDYLSVVDRKNPLGALDAYVQAFADDGEAQLLLKATNADRRPDDHQRVVHAARDRSDVHVFTGHLTSPRYAALLASAAAVVSLHRSEGLALNLADAIALGVPVIATDYGGNVDFMDADDTYLVPYRMIDVGPGHHPYPSDARWADPDVGHACECLRDVLRDPARARARAGQAQARVAARFGLDAAAASVAQRLAAITPAADPVGRWSSRLRQSFHRS
jgi:glycosyltransferase involved in cell wall biosynthesis